jgi:hypothetical protein
MCAPVGAGVGQWLVPLAADSGKEGRPGGANPFLNGCWRDATIVGNVGEAVAEGERSCVLEASGRCLAGGLVQPFRKRPMVLESDLPSWFACHGRNRNTM